ncbi:hypothetical protein VHEMI05933 [[Torrubiella] hemipterigena]|uniref:Aspartate racemase n=1 Tax=[Torrubiella] hemipterigena TaxID=1531966 RepID=A0A0A1T5P4_9HYPO|nr:hypothetical protein VHEMI05933 [[Torrubiella] hemipterigena]
MAIKTVGFLGGMTAHSTVPYYTQINEHVAAILGPPNWASIIMYSFAYEEANALFMANDWAGVAAKFIATAKNMRTSGAQAIVIGCNAGHKVFDALQDAMDVPVLHIADATAQTVQKRGIKKVGLLGTEPVMRDDFIKKRLLEKAEGLQEVVVPESDEIDHLQNKVMPEVAAGKVSEEQRLWMVNMTKKLVERGAEAVVLGCTDFQFIIKAKDVGEGVLIDTMEEHARYIAEWSVGKI